MNDRISSWVICGPQGVKWHGLAADESAAWDYAFGWPGEAEIKELRAQGYYAAPATLQWERQ